MDFRGIFLATCRILGCRFPTPLHRGLSWGGLSWGRSNGKTTASWEEMIGDAVAAMLGSSGPP